MVENMKKTLLVIASAALVSGFVACSDVVGIGDDFAGTYDLQSVNGFTLPTVIFDDGLEQDELLSETFTIYREGSYTDDYTLRTSSRSGQSTSSYRDDGTWTRNGTHLEFADSRNGATFSGELDGRTLTIFQGGDSYVYRR
jgi:predicted small secreted protein